MGILDRVPGSTNPESPEEMKYYVQGAGDTSGCQWTTEGDATYAGTVTAAGGIAGPLTVDAAGADARAGTVTLPGTDAGVTVNTSAVTADSIILCTVQLPAGTVGAPRVQSRVPGVSFTIRSSQTLDTSVVGWVLFEPV